MSSFAYLEGEQVHWLNKIRNAIHNDKSETFVHFFLLERFDRIGHFVNTYKTVTNSYTQINVYNTSDNKMFETSVKLYAKSGSHNFYSHRKDVNITILFIVHYFRCMQSKLVKMLPVSSLAKTTLFIFRIRFFDFRSLLERNCSVSSNLKAFVACTMELILGYRKVFISDLIDS